MEKEEWRRLQENDNYEVSSWGRIKSYGRSDYKWKAPRILKPRSLPTGYLRVFIGKTEWYIHRLVAVTFLENPTNLPLVNHIDADRTNNFVTNLEWCTQQHNLAHAVKIGTMKPQNGDGNHARKLSSSQVREIRKTYKPFVFTRPMLAKKYNVSEAAIGCVLSGKYWSQID